MSLLAFSFIPEGLGDATLFLVLGSVAAGLVAMAKTGFGGSIGILSVPILIYACGGHTFLAIGLMLPLLVACDVVGIIIWWGRWSWRPVWLLLPGAVLGVLGGCGVLWLMRRTGPVGAAEDQAVAEAHLRLAIGVIALGFVLLQAIKALRSRSRPLAFRPVLWQGTIFGGLAGFTSALAHAAGPITTMYMLPQGMAKDRYVASTVLYYAIGNQLKVVPYILLGMLSPKVLAASVSLLPAVVAGAFAGIYLHNRIGQRSFNAVVYALLALAGVDLIHKAVGLLWA